MTDTMTKLKSRFGEIYDLNAALSVVEWDALVMMRPRGATLRGDVVGTLSTLQHERWIDPAFGELLEKGKEETASLPDGHPDKASVHVAYRDRERKVRVPTELASEMAKHGAIAYAIWVESRKNNDFAAFAPALEKHLDFQLRYVACFDKTEHPYDVSLAQWDLEYTTAELNVLFAQLKAGFRPIIDLVSANPGAANDDAYLGHFPKATQAAMFNEFALACGARADVWRLDETVHPFETAPSMDDVRITTRYYEDDIASGFFGTLHETGHGLYEDGVDRSLARLPIGHGGTLDMHESQSRMIENLVGRSRPFFDYALPIFRKYFPEKYNSIDAETLYRSANIMRPSLIRVEADEATYNMHIALRFEIEQELIAGNLKVADLPEVWRGKMEELLGVTPPDDTNGVLQDVHWSSGAFGTFVGYTLGNVIGAQLWPLINADLPNLDDQFAAGEFLPLREWLREKIHKHGQTYGTKETLARIGIEALDPEPLRASIAAKAHEIYG
ncbi:carboxypeptidase M32 [soil metagenome]